MRIVKISDKFFSDCKLHNTDRELLLNETGRPSVLVVKLKYKNNNHKFVIPMRSNISPKTPKNQFLQLPPNSNTKPKHFHGVHYIKLFPITDKYVEKYIITKEFDLMIKQIIDSKEQEIISSCQKYLNQVENGNKHAMTPDIDGILKWL